mgnify:CR=1 FL=1
MKFHQAHLMFLALWGGVVLAESVVELWGRKNRDLMKAAAIFHFWIDVLVEAPIILLVIASGVVLLFTIDNLTYMHAIMIAAAFVAISANAYCIVAVIRRYQDLHRTGMENLPARTQQVFLSAIAGMPLAALAAGLGLYLTLTRFGG